jgi:thiosulfate/3-mercaptopyruvate sulfurtransferase
MTTATAKETIEAIVARQFDAINRHDAKALAALLGSKGISSDQTIVLYGGNNNWFAAYAYWLLTYRGIDNVRLLDGGRAKWELEGHTLTDEVPEVAVKEFRAGEDRPELRAFRDDVVALAGQGQFVDVRSPAEFSGEVLAPPHLPEEQPYVPGHVPGAANVPWAKAAKEDGSFRSPDELRELYSGAGVDLSAPVITYCRIGERSAHTWFVLKELLGVEDVRNYDGSWTEYGSLVGVPVEVGD